MTSGGELRPYGIRPFPIPNKVTELGAVIGWRRVPRVAWTGSVEENERAFRESRDRLLWGTERL